MMRFIRENLLENWSLKLTAIFLALVLWLFIRGEPGPERVVAVPLEIQVPRNMEITNQRPTSVEVTMRGAVLSNTWFNQPLPTCVINLQGSGQEGEHVIALTAGNIRTSRGSDLEVLRVNPARIKLVLERTISKEVPIVVPIQGELPKGYEIYGKFPRPATVIVTGARSHIELIRDIPTEAVSISGQKEPVTYFAGLNVRDSSVRTSVSTPIQVNLQIGPRRELYTIAHVLVIVDRAAFTITPKRISIQVMAPITLRDDLTPANVDATVETKNLDISRLPVMVKPNVKLTGKLDGATIIKRIQPPEVVVSRNRRE